MVIRAGWDCNRLLSNLSQAAVEAILPRLADVPLVRGEVLREGVYFPFSGLIAEFVLIKDRQSYTGIMGKDGTVHLEYLGVPPPRFRPRYLRRAGQPGFRHPIFAMFGLAMARFERCSWATANPG